MKTYRTIAGRAAFSYQAKRFILGGFILVTIAACASRTRSTKEIVYLIPENFEGAVVIIYGQSDGATPDMDTGKLVFRIPADGLLKVNASKRTADGSPKFFYAHNDGRQTEIELLVSSDPTNKFRTSRQVSDEEREDTIFATSYENGEFLTANGAVQFRNFRIGKDKDGNYNYTRMQEKITDVQRTFPR
ncbi:MAG: hypothetical protein IPI64_09180 [Chloracidobacterium sp.]|nr:hypothetical protein [Chloracidobacterium sp.]